MKTLHSIQIRKLGFILLQLLAVLGILLWNADAGYGQGETITVKSFYGVQNGVQKKVFTNWNPGEIRTSSWQGINFPGGESSLDVDLERGLVGSVSKAGAFGGILRNNMIRAEHIAQFTGKAHVKVSVVTGIQDKSGGIGLPYWEVNNMADFHGRQEARMIKRYLPVKESAFLVITVPGMSELSGALEAAIDQAMDVVITASGLEEKLKQALGIKEVFTTVFEKDMDLIRGANYFLGGGHEIKIACSGTIAQSVEAISVVTVEITETGSKDPSWVHITDIKPNGTVLSWERCELDDFFGYTVQYHEVVGKDKSWNWINDVTSEGYEVDRNRTRNTRIISGLKSSTPYEFRVVTTFKSGSPSFSKVVSAKTAYAPLPDLVVTGVSTDPDHPFPNSRFKLNVTIANEGNAPTPASGFSYNGTVDNKEIIQGYLPQLKPGKSNTFSLPYTFSNALPHTIKITADPTREVQESSETNNERSFTIAYPDIRIKDLACSPASPEAQKTVNIRASLENVGKAPLYGSGYLVYQVFSNNNLIATSNSGLGVLYPGQTWQINVPYSFPAAGLYTLKISADPENKVAEISETNNDKSISVSILPPPPDLVVEEFICTPSGNWKMTGKGLVSFSVRIKNNGAGPADARGYAAYSIISDGVPIRNVNKAAGLPPLQPGKTWSDQDSYTFNDGKSHQLKLTVDPGNKVQEVSETNNDKTVSLQMSIQTVVVPATRVLPDIRVAKMTINPATPKQRETATLSVLVENTGHSDCSAPYYCSYDLYLNGALYTQNRDAICRGPMQPGKTWTTTIPIVFTTAGANTVKIVMDPDNKASEMSETNNSYSLSVKVIQITITPY